MLRRRSKTPKVARHVPRETGERSLRRARPDAPVPSELLLRSGNAPAHEARSGKPPARKPLAGQPPRGGGVVLVTGFEPFGGESGNPSWDICTQLPRSIRGATVETCRVPCEFRHAIEVAAAAIERYRPAIVLCLGQAGGRAHLSVERVAINVDDARVADNAGERPVDEPIAAAGPPAYFATLPVKAMAAAMRATDAPAEVSNSAGTYVCNHLMYGVLHFLAASGIAARAGFIHVPYAEYQVLDKPGVACMALATMTRAVEAAIVAALENATDITVSEGTLA